MTLVEKASANIDEDEAAGLVEKMMGDNFNYNDMLSQFKMMNKMGSANQLLGMLPGMGNIKKTIGNVDENQFKMLEVIINSMTKAERRDPELIEKSSRRRTRISNGSGRSMSDVNKLRKSLEAQKVMAKRMTSMSKMGDMGDMNNMDLSKMDLQSLMGGMKPKKSRGKGRKMRKW